MVEIHMSDYATYRDLIEISRLAGERTNRSSNSTKPRVATFCKSAYQRQGLTLSRFSVEKTCPTENKRLSALRRFVGR
jgi:hypothetical protein